MSKNKNAPIAIIGGGAWGLSTSYHLIEEGYRNFTVFEGAPEIPCQYSAAYDLNRIVRAEYEDEFHTQLALVSLTIRLCSLLSLDNSRDFTKDSTEASIANLVLFLAVGSN